MKSKTLTKLQQKNRRERFEQLAVAFLTGATSVIALVIIFDLFRVK